MIDIGKINSLTISYTDEYGVWVESEEPLKLPKRELSSGAKPGEKVAAFVYRDGSGELLATTRIPMAQVGEFASMKVTQLTKHGAFLYWGMKKDILVPYGEQQDRMQEGRYYIVRVLLDDRERIVGSSKLEFYLDTVVRDLKPGQEVDLTIWAFTDLGAKVIVNNRYEALIYQDELEDGLRVGNKLKGYVQRIRPDMKLDISLRKTGKEGIDENKEAVLAALELDGFLPLHDKSDPDEIKELLNMSKKGFKKAIGGLYKEGIIELTDSGIRLKGR